MDIDITKEKDTVTITITGKIDTEGSNELSKRFQEVAEDDPVMHVILDLSEVRAITSAGIGSLLRLYKHFDKKGGTTKIEGISETLKKQFVEIHLDQIIPIG